MGHTPIIFVKPYPPYNVGEVAGFPKAEFDLIPKECYMLLEDFRKQQEAKANPVPKKVEKKKTGSKK